MGIRNGGDDAVEVPPVDYGIYQCGLAGADIPREQDESLGATYSIFQSSKRLFVLIAQPEKLGVWRKLKRFCSQIVMGKIHEYLERNTDERAVFQFMTV
ncbi:MAG: hypothetical protein V3W07_00430 [Syntrophobacteria bacterium]